MTDSRYKALVFDCDGTLADTMPAHFIAWTRTLNAHGISFTEERFYALGGVPPAKIIAMLADEHGLTLDVPAVTQQKEDTFHDVIGAVRRIEPVTSIAERHRGQMPMAVATGTERWSASRVLTQLGILDWFDALVCADDVTHHKPHPETYLEAARRLSVAPEECQAFEDTDLGMRAASDAGMDVVDVRPMYQTWLEELEAAG
jgi:beta-phosphoglucomutase family hydrolase